MEASSPPSQGGPEEEEGAAQVQLWDFPPDVLARLSEEMELRDVVALGASCRALRRVVETNNAAMWADTYRRHWPGVWTAWSPLQNPRASIGASDRVEVDWRRAFRWRFETTRQVCLPTTLSLAHSQIRSPVQMVLLEVSRCRGGGTEPSRVYVTHYPIGLVRPYSPVALSPYGGVYFHISPPYQPCRDGETCRPFRYTRIYTSGPGGAAVLRCRRCINHRGAASGDHPGSMWKASGLNTGWVSRESAARTLKGGVAGLGVRYDRWRLRTRRCGAGRPW